MYYRAIGSPASVVIESTAGFTHLAGGAAGPNLDLFIDVLDASGFSLWDNTQADDDVVDANFTIALTAASVGDVADVATDVAGGAADDGLWELAATACDDAAADYGEVFAFTATIAGVAGTASVTSAPYSVTCTDNVATYITSVTLLNSSVNPSGTQRIVYHLEDINGLPLGFGGTSDLTGTTASAEVTIVTAPFDEGAFTEVAAAAVADGTVTTDDVLAGQERVTLTASGNNPGVKSVIVTIADSDLDAVGNQAAEYKLTYTVLDPTAGAATSSTIAASVNAAKRIGSFTLSAAAGKLVTITVERVSDGKVWTYYRKANASGVATFLIRKFGRFDVFASYGDDVTDTVRMRRR